jgi:hypothetical protein
MINSHRIYDSNKAKYSPNVALTDQDASMMVRLGQSELEDLSLQTTLQEIFDLKTQNVIELHAGFVQHSDTNETTQQGIT